MSEKAVTSNREIFSRMNLSQKLPSPPRMAIELVRLCHSESPSFDDIARLLATDPALSAALLKNVNGEALDAALVTETKIASIPQAAAQIGKHGLINLALDFSLATKIANGPCQAFNYESFWSKSLAQAIAASAIAKKIANFNAEEIYACGLLAGIGELMLATSFPNEYSSILIKKLPQEQTLASEKNSFGLNRYELTAELFRYWGLSDSYSQAAALHPLYPEVAPDDVSLKRLIEVLYLASKISDIALTDSPNHSDFTLVEDLAAQFGIYGEDFSRFFDEITATWEERGDLLRIRPRSCPPYQEIKVMNVPRGDYSGYQSNEQLTILAVDDDPISLETITQYLRGKYRRVLAAQGGQRALKLALEEKPDMVITDWRMPELDGIGLCKILRRTSLTEHTYIIMLSGCETDDELVQAFNAGADDYVTKPFSPKVLEARIRSGARLVRYHQTISRDRKIIEQYASQLSAANKQLQVVAMTDPLTGLPNRRNAMLRMKDAVIEASRFRENLSCIMLDIDHFKCINDTYGHDVGDMVLRDVANIFSNNVRGYDMVSRMGGEEFLVICGRSSLNDAKQLAERLRLAVAHHEVRTPIGQIVRCTISCGVAIWHRHYRNDSEFLKNADRALYRAKNNGRDRVEVAG